MKLARDGSRAAFGVLVERHADRLARACTSFVEDSAAGAELAQETWAAAWAARSRYRAEGKFFVWLLTSARNRCRNHRRHEGVGRNHAARETGAGLEPASPTQIDVLPVEERRRRVREALARVPERMREALLLRYA